MKTRLLIDAIVRQTTVLLAQLSTAAGIRAPLAHVADEVFLSLSREIEAQGVGRKVAADMFGLALRTYQKKVQRLAESATEREKTLWEAVLDLVAERGSVTRRQILDRFAGDEERDVVGVLTDLVSTGLVHASGRGSGAVYGLTTDAERGAIAAEDDAQTIAAFAWAMIRNSSNITTTCLVESLRIDIEVARATVRRLEREGRVERADGSDESTLKAVPLVVPVGAEMGWEVAVFDHFRALSNAIAAKVRRGSARSSEADDVGGGTLSFPMRPGHPFWDRVHGLLAKVRADANSLWREVEAYNASNASALPENENTTVWFYFGQYVDRNAGEDEAAS